MNASLPGVELNGPLRQRAVLRAEPRILFLDQTGQLGGAELMLLDVAGHFRENARVVLFQDGPFREALAEARVACSVEALDGRVSALDKDAGAFGMVRAVPGFLRQVLRIRRHLRNVELIYANTAKALITGALANIGTGLPLVYHLHDIVGEGHFSRLNQELIVRFSNRFARKVIANSEATREAFVAAGGDRSRVEVIYNGFDAKVFERPDSLGALVPGGNDGARIFGVFGRLTDWKGQAVFLEALARCPDAEGWMVGDALFTDDDRRYALELKRRAGEPDLAGRVRFFGFQRDIVPLLHRVDVVVHCSTRPEPFGRVIVEAMLAGKPVIATRAGGALEIVDDGNTGLLTEPNDAHGLATAMTRLADEPETAARLAKDGRSAARERFSLPSVLARIHAVLESVRAV